VDRLVYVTGHEEGRYLLRDVASADTPYERKTA
jgi:hypothetical protein